MDLGKLGNQGQTLTQDEFNILVEHKNGVHEDNEQYNCPICRFDIEKWRQEQMTKIENVEPQDAVPEPWIGSRETGR